MVSIITPVYNSQQYLEECLLSVISQTYEDWEHILVDDCSTDDSEKIVKAFVRKDPRLRYYRLEKNSGAGVARNKAIEMASGDYIAFLDSDDFWHPKKLEQQTAFMEENALALSYTSYYTIDPSGKILYIRKAPSRVSYEMILRNGYIGCLTAMYNANMIGKYYMPAIRKRQDWALWIKILKDWEMAKGISTPLAYYRTGNDSISSNKLKLIKHNFLVYNQTLGYSKLESTWMMLKFLFFYFLYKGFSKKPYKGTES